MAFRPDPQDAYGDLTEINIVPLVDVMLVLLIIFMVTAPLSIGGINIQLPKAKARGSAMDEDRIILSVNPEGEYYLDKLRIPSEQLEARLGAIYQARVKKEIYIRADHKVAYGAVISAMSAARLAGVVKIAMLTEPLK